MSNTKQEPFIDYVFIALFGFFAIFIMALRLIMRKVRRRPFELSDYLTMIAIVCVLARSAFSTVVLLYGNNNTTIQAWSATHFTPELIGQLEIGSKLTLTDRLTYNLYLWLQKSIVLLLFDRLFYSLPLAARLVNICWAALLVTFISVEVACFVDCMPFKLYFQVVPYPGPCVQAPIQLFVFVTLNIATDFMLILLPMPWLFKLKTSLIQRIQVICLFSIGILLIIIGFIRLPVYSNSTSQLRRQEWGSIETFCAAFVANVPTLFTLRPRRDRLPSQQTPRCTAQNPRLPDVSEDRIIITSTVTLSHEEA